VFHLLEQTVIGTKKATGRPGMDLWHVLVLGVVRLALDCDDDRLEYMVHHDTLLRRIMGLESHFSGEFGKGFHDKTLSENVCHVDEALLAEMNALVVQAGRSLKKISDLKLRSDERSIWFIGKFVENERKRGGKPSNLYGRADLSVSKIRALHFPPRHANIEKFPSLSKGTDSECFQIQQKLPDRAEGFLSKKVVPEISDILNEDVRIKSDFSDSSSMN